MADLSHELGALRFVVDSPLSSKVAMFNNQVQQHKNAQLLNPFSQTDGRASPKPVIDKEGYGKPLAGSLTEMRGQKANMHVLREMLELCQIIDSEGYDVKDEPNMRVITFGELFNIYNYISDKCVGILLRARKHKLVEFEGEMLFQRRDDDVPIFLLKPIVQIRREMDEKIDSIKRAGSPAPQATSVLLDKKSHGLSVPSKPSPTPSPQSSKASSPAKEMKPPSPTPRTPAPAVSAATPTPATAPSNAQVEKPKIQISGEETEAEAQTAAELKAPTQPEAAKEPEIQQSAQPEAASTTAVQQPEAATAAAVQAPEAATSATDQQPIQPATEVPAEVQAEAAQPNEVPAPTPEATATEIAAAQPTQEADKSDVNNNPADLPTVVIEATAVYVPQSNAVAAAPETLETTAAAVEAAAAAPEAAVA